MYFGGGSECCEVELGAVGSEHETLGMSHSSHFVNFFGKFSEGHWQSVKNKKTPQVTFPILFTVRRCGQTCLLV